MCLTTGFRVRKCLFCLRNASKADCVRSNGTFATPFPMFFFSCVSFAHTHYIVLRPNRRNKRILGRRWKTKSAYRIAYREITLVSKNFTEGRETRSTPTPQSWCIRSAWMVVKDTAEVRRLEVKSCAAWCRVYLEFQRDPLLNSGTSGRISRRRAREDVCNGRRERISLARSR